MLNLIFAVLGSWLVLSLSLIVAAILQLFLTPLALLFRKLSKPAAAQLVSYSLAAASSTAVGSAAMYLSHLLCQYLQVIPSYGMLLPVIPQIYVRLLSDTRKTTLMFDRARANSHDDFEEVNRFAAFEAWASGALVGTTVGLFVGAFYFWSNANLLLPERMM